MSRNETSKDGQLHLERRKGNKEIWPSEMDT